MFGKSFFGARYWGPRYFGPSLETVTVTGALASGAANINGQATLDQINEFLHPNGNISNDSWEGQDGGTVDLWRYVDEFVANDADYLRSPVVPAGEPFRVSLSNPIETVVPDTPVIVRYRIGKTNAGASVDFTVRLYAGVTLVVEWSHPNVAAGFTTQTKTLTAPQIAAISDFDDLELEFEAAA